MTPETILLPALSVLCAVLVLIIIFMLIRRKGGTDNSSVFLSISRRLDDLSTLSVKFAELEKMFFSSKHRGQIGETLLEELIKNTLPRGTYDFQHRYQDGSRVDAMLFLGERKLPVDAKFPMEIITAQDAEKKASLARTFVQYMKDISGKYIKPGEGTVPFAIMYIPSESVYYDGFIRPQGKTDMFREAQRYRVIPAGPSSFLLFLQTILYGLRGVSIDKNMDNYLQLFEQFNQDFASFSHSFATFGTHLKNTHNSFEEALSRFHRMDMSLRRLEGMTEKNFGIIRED